MDVEGLVGIGGDGFFEDCEERGAWFGLEDGEVFFEVFEGVFANLKC